MRCRPRTWPSTRFSRLTSASLSAVYPGMAPPWTYTPLGYQSGTGEIALGHLPGEQVGINRIIDARRTLQVSRVVERIPRDQMSVIETARQIDPPLIRRGRIAGSGQYEDRRSTGGSNGSCALTGGWPIGAHQQTPRQRRAKRRRTRFPLVRELHRALLVTVEGQIRATHRVERIGGVVQVAAIARPIGAFVDERQQRCSVTLFDSLRQGRAQAWEIAVGEVQEGQHGIGTQRLGQFPAIL